jgi:hypothetical protein
MHVTHRGSRFPGTAVVVAALVAVGVFLGLASSAQAACSYPDAEQVFAKWGDSDYYELAPDGGFEEGGNGWEFSGGAELVDGNEDHFLNDPADDTSLRIPYGGVATSPMVCVDDTTPRFRLMALNAGDDGSKLYVKVTYVYPDETRVKVADVRAEDDWEPTEALKLDTRNSQEVAARISFSPKDDEGDWLIDDLYIDPFTRR